MDHIKNYSSLTDKIRYEKMFAKIYADYLKCLQKDLDKDLQCKKVIANFHEFCEKVDPPIPSQTPS